MHESEQQVIDQPTAGSRAAQARTEPETLRRHTPAGSEAVAAAGQGAAPSSGDLTDELLRSDQWTDEMLHAAGIPVTDVPLVSVGGGIGSFVTVDHPRIPRPTPPPHPDLFNPHFPPPHHKTPTPPP